MPDNLWGNLSDLEMVKTPVAILKEQAAYLTDATKGLLKGEVNSVGAPYADLMGTTGLAGLFDRSASRKNKIYYELDVVAPVLNDYRYTILRISHGIDLYPVRVEGPDTAVSECENEAEYLNTLQNILGSREVHKVLASLLAQSES